MSTAQVSSSLAHSESKSARKKKAKAEAPVPTTAASPTEPESGAGQTAVDGVATGADGSYESPYIKELYK